MQFSHEFEGQNEGYGALKQLKQSQARPEPQVRAQKVERLHQLKRVLLDPGGRYLLWDGEVD